MAFVQGQRNSVQVDYLTSGVCNQHCLHFFQAQERELQASPQTARRKRLIVLADRATYLAEMDNAVNRCVAISRVTSFNIFDSEMGELTRSNTTQYDILLEMLLPVDFARVIPAVFRPNDPYNSIPTYELEEKQPIQENVFVRETTLYFEDNGALEYNTTSARVEEVTRRMLDDKDKEVTELRSALNKQKDSYVIEMVDLQNRVEELKHALDQSEYLLKAAKQGGNHASPPNVLATGRRLQEDVNRYDEREGEHQQAWVPVSPSATPPHGGGAKYGQRVHNGVNVGSPLGHHARLASPTGRPSGTTTINVFKRNGGGKGAFTSAMERR